MRQIHLTAESAARLRAAFDDMPPWPLTNRHMARLLQACAALPTDVVEQLLAFRADPAVPPAMLVTGLPVDEDLPPTPTDTRGESAKSGCVSEYALLAFAMLLGEPVAYRAEKDGALVQNVYPTVAQRDAPSNESSAASLGFHTELTFSRWWPDRPLHAAAPDFVLLLGLRCPAERAATTAIVPADRACARVGAENLTVLRQPQFQLMAPYSFTRDGDGGRPWSPPVALVHGPPGAPSVAFDTACGVRALSPAGEQALSALKEACDDPDLRDSVQLGAGDLFILDNHRCAHSRSSFPAFFDGGDRWLQRGYVRRDLRSLPAGPGEWFRVLA
jgi:L-asparagine oxygenase